MSSGEEAIHVSRNRPGVTSIVLNRPARRNALRARDCMVMRDAINEASVTSSCVTIRGAGGNFCAGADLSEVLSDSEEQRARIISAWTDLLLCVMRAPVPVIAIVEGACVGGGHHLNLVSDVSLAHSDATFKNSGADIDMIPMELGSLLLPAAIGWRRAKAYVLTSRSYGAEEAVDLGVCIASGAGEEFDALIEEWTGAITVGGARTIAVAKAILNAEALRLTGPVSLSTALGLSQLANAEARRRVSASLAEMRGRKAAS
jgi:enoyl-CoA hydratase/carnithine racemase